MYTFLQVTIISQDVFQNELKANCFRIDVLKVILQEVVSLIKKNPLRTELLVASEEVDLWYTENHMEYSFSRVDLYNFESGSPVSFALNFASADSVLDSILDDM